MSTAQSVPHRLHRWHQTPAGLAAFMLVELCAFYAVVSLAIDSGSLWYYGVGIGLLVGMALNAAKLVMRTIRKRK